MDNLPAWIDITSEDAERSRAFYRDLLGWEIQVEESMNYGLVQPTPDPLARRHRPSERRRPYPPGVVVYFTVADIDTALERAEHLGGTPLVPPWQIPGLGKMAVLGDPDGNCIGLWQT